VTPVDVLLHYPDDPFIRAVTSDYLEECGQTERAESLRMVSGESTLEEVLAWITEG
jgi:uncharacterized protein (TIGR02996 family)